MLRDNIEMWGFQNRRQTCPSELWAPFLEALEVSGTPGDDQGSLNEASKNSKVTIREYFEYLWAARVPLAVPKEVPRSRLRAKMNFQVAQKSSTEALKSSENYL